MIELTEKHRWFIHHYTRCSLRAGATLQYLGIIDYHISVVHRHFSVQFLTAHRKEKIFWQAFVRRIADKALRHNPPIYVTDRWVFIGKTEVNNFHGQNYDYRQNIVGWNDELRCYEVENV